MFANNSKKFLDEYSNEFHTSYYEILKRRGESRVLANKIYQEVYLLFLFQACFLLKKKQQLSSDDDLDRLPRLESGTHEKRDRSNGEVSLYLIFRLC